MIPNIFHFICFGEMPLGLTHYLAVASARSINQPDAIWLHCDHEPSGPYADKIRSLVRINRVKAPETIHGNPVLHPAHQADVYRLQILQEMGGIYLDLDTICVKTLSLFYRYPLVVGKQTTVFPWNWKQRIKKCVLERTFKFLRRPLDGLCNGVILAEKGSEFLRIWQESYRTFRSKGKDEYWCEHSVKIPLVLAHQNPRLIHLASEWSFHYPLFDDDGLRDLFVFNKSFPRAYVHHLWETYSRERYLNALTVETIKTRDTTYNLLARKYL